MNQLQRREFLADVGRGMFVAGLGSSVALELGLSPALAEETGNRITFDKLEPLVALMQETPIDKLLPALTTEHRKGTDLRTLIAAGALANTRTFGGQDYTGFHAFMAMPPALDMSREMPADQQALPVFKVLYRNSDRIQHVGGSAHEVMHPLHGEESSTPVNEKTLRQAVHKPDMKAAEKQFSRMVSDDLQTAFDNMQYIIQEEVDVHRVVLCWRAWTMLEIAGKEYASSLLRQSVRYCVDAEQKRLARKRSASGIRKLLPQLFDEHKLLGKTPGNKQPDNAWVEKLADTIYGAGREQAAEAVAAALAEGFAPEAIGEAMSLAANLLVLRDPGRQRGEDGKPKGSVHGASVGVHASDSANAWRGIARVGNHRNTMASLIVGAYHTGGQNGGQNKESQPHEEVLAKVTVTDPQKILQLTEAAIRSNDQAMACALTQRYAEQGQSPKPLFDLFLKYAVSEDGALHAEKYYRTVNEDFRTTRPAFRLRHLIALARVTASEYGFPAPGYADARKLLKLS